MSVGCLAAVKAIRIGKSALLSCITEIHRDKQQLSLSLPAINVRDKSARLRLNWEKIFSSKRKLNKF